mmetsp:Transcript_83733/g.203108  ORF Transcript_83733/g.203108 Transcript_83733/m.203108 type:complete len:334 (+) Transcript_83733:93-1094(+)
MEKLRVVGAELISNLQAGGERSDSRESPRTRGAIHPHLTVVAGASPKRPPTQDTRAKSRIVVLEVSGDRELGDHVYLRSPLRASAALRAGRARVDVAEAPLVAVPVRGADTADHEAAPVLGPLVAVVVAHEVVHPVRQGCAGALPERCEQALHVHAGLAAQLDLVPVAQQVNLIRRVTRKVLARFPEEMVLSLPGMRRGVAQEAHVPQGVVEEEVLRAGQLLPLPGRKVRPLRQERSRASGRRRVLREPLREAEAQLVLRQRGLRSEHPEVVVPRHRQQHDLLRAPGQVPPELRGQAAVDVVEGVAEDDEEVQPIHSSHQVQQLGQALQNIPL